MGRRSAMLGEFGKERSPSVLECPDLGPELFQLAVDALQLGPRLLFSEVSLTMLGADQLLDLTAEQPQPPAFGRRSGQMISVPQPPPPRVGHRS
jgi:hypothetical protein